MADAMRTRESATDDQIQWYNDHYEWISVDINYPETVVMRQYAKSDHIWNLTEEERKKRVLSDLKSDLFRYGL